jgi:hypothetical protein
MKKYLIIFITIVVVACLPSVADLGAAGAQITVTPQSVLSAYQSFLPSIFSRSNPPTPVPHQITPTVRPPSTPVPVPEGMILVDHRSVDLFDQIPDYYLEAARNLGMLFSDRSVGDNINSKLDCPAAPTWADSSNGCRRAYYDSDWNWRLYLQDDLNAGVVPPEIMFTPDPVKYNRDNWSYEHREGDWSYLTEDFIKSLAPSYLASKDILSYQFSYLNVDENDTISDPDLGFFADNSNMYDIFDLEAFIAQHPDKIFMFWTSSLARSIGTQVSTDFNNQMRQYAIANNKILFDVADIESHRPDGTSCYDNRDGVQYCNTVTLECENYPDDGFDFPAICQEYTTEVDAGHLGSISEGGLRIARAFWVLMARVAGWDGVSTTNP